MQEMLTSGGDWVGMIRRVGCGAGMKLKSIPWHQVWES